MGFSSLASKSAHQVLALDRVAPVAVRPKGAIRWDDRDGGGNQRQERDAVERLPVARWQYKDI